MTDADLGGGVSLKSTDDSANGQDVKHGETSQASRALALGSYFLSGAMAINASQFFGAPLALVNKDWYNAWIAFTKQSFGLLTMTMTQWWAPTVVKVSGDKSMRGQLMKTKEGDLKCEFPERLVLIANHQIYTDWMYLWWIAYTNGMHGRLYIILKESLKRIPVLGWGMQLSQFIFLKRNWEQDKSNMQKHLAKLNNPSDPMWLMLFPEGTNLAPDTRERSRAWARKNGINDMQHQLLPRSTGLHFCLQELQKSVGWVYDCTIAYDGVPRGQYAQDIYTLKSSYLEGRPPKAVYIYWRRFAVSKIPLKDEATFEKWLQARWREKDYLLEMWHRTGQFPADTGAEKLPDGRIRRGCGHLEVPVRPAQWYEFLQIFAPMGVLALVLSVFYSALPESFMKSMTKQAENTTIPGLQVNGATLPLSLGSLLSGDGQGDIFQNVAATLQKLTATPDPSVMSDYGSLNGEVTAKKNFLQVMEEEEISRKRQKKAAGLKPATAPKSVFWQDLKDEEAKRRGSAVTAPSQLPSALVVKKGTFWDDMNVAEKSRNGSISSMPPSAAGAKKGNFWEDMEAAEKTRHGSISSVSTKPPSTVGTSKILRPVKPPNTRVPSSSALSTKSLPISASKAKSATSGAPKLVQKVTKPVPQQPVGKTIPKKIAPAAPQVSKPVAVKPAAVNKPAPKPPVKAAAPAAKKPLLASTRKPVSASAQKAKPQIAGTAPKKLEGKSVPPKLARKAPMQTAQAKPAQASKPKSSITMPKKLPAKPLTKT